MTTREVLAAQRKVRSTNEKFEEALDQVGMAVGDTAEKVSNKVEDIQYKIQTPQRIVKNISEKAQVFAGYGLDYAYKAADEGKKLYELARVKAEPAVEHVKRNKNIYMTAAGVLAAVGLGYFFWKRRGIAKTAVTLLGSSSLRDDPTSYGDLGLTDNMRTQGVGP